MSYTINIPICVITFDHQLFIFILYEKWSYIDAPTNGILTGISKFKYNFTLDTLSNRFKQIESQTGRLIDMNCFGLI